MQKTNGQTDWSNKLTELGKDALRAINLYKPSHEDVYKRSQWMAEIVVLRALTDFKDKGVWDSDLFIGDHSDSVRRNRYLQASETLENPQMAVRSIRAQVDTDKHSFAYHWEKTGKAPTQSQKLEAFAIKVQSRIGNDPSAVMQEIENKIVEIKLQLKATAELASRPFFQELASGSTKPQQASKPGI